ncbi:MAG: hypothetical protein LBC79_01225 [Deltaproteobacteria bacterium]|nr:hypothetical protein [Deltaproteobacteria bacterium]
MPATASIVEQNSAVMAPSLPYMNHEELRLFWESIPKGGVCLEFGMGGSTRLFFARGAAALYSVEGDLSFMKMVCDDPLLRAKFAANIFFPIYANIGQVGEWSVPVGHPTPIWLNYHHNIWEKIAAQTLDFTLIDGRFRVACALQCFLRCRRNNMYLIHDFTIRPEYHLILKYADIMEQAGSSVLLKRRSRVDYKKVALDLLNAQFSFS